MGSDSEQKKTLSASSLYIRVIFLALATSLLLIQSDLVGRRRKIAIAPDTERRKSTAPVSLVKQQHEPKSQRCALIFFGLPKVFRKIVLPSIKKHIIDINPTCDVYVHAYNFTVAPENPRNGEIGNEALDVTEIYDIFDGFKVNSRMYPPPPSVGRNLIITSDEQFLRDRDLKHYQKYFPYESFLKFPTSLNNMIRQWHSIGLAWDLMEKREKEDKLHWWNEKRGISPPQMTNMFTSPVYERVGFFRSDVEYRSPIDISNGDAVVPRFNNEKFYMTDRMFYGLRHFAGRWQGNTRFDFIEIYFKSSFGKRYKLHSERFLYYLFRFMPLTFNGNICFVRVRANGKFQNEDCKIKLANRGVINSW